MSTRKGANLRSRPQKHKNRTVFKNDLYGATPQIKFLNTMNVCEVCERCKEVIDWKIKYKKYKPLSQPRTCQKCGLRNVRKAYHVNCTECALKLRCCAKCNKSADDVNILPPEPTPQEQMKLDQEMQLLIKKLPERKRRTFLRYMKKGKKKQKEGEGEEGQNGDGDSDPEVDDSEGDEEEANKTEVVEPVEKVKEKTIPYTKEELLLKLEQMKLALENDADFEDDFFGSDFDEEEEEDDFDDEDGEEEEEEEEDDSEEEEKPVDVKKKGVTFENGVKK